MVGMVNDVRRRVVARAQSILSTPPAGLITDVDGTISEIVGDPAAAVVEADVAGTLSELGRHLALVALVSGRSVEQLRRMVDVEGIAYVGNHGLEWWEEGKTKVVPEAGPYLGTVAVSLNRLRKELKVPGIIIEDKGVSGTVHYRLAANPASARVAVLDAANRCAASLGLKVAEGRKSLNILPPVTVDKGSAVERLVRDHRLRGAVYLGDDSTDLNAFKALRGLARGRDFHLLLVAVCATESPDGLQQEADYCLHSVSEAKGFLQELLEPSGSGFARAGLPY